MRNRLISIFLTICLFANMPGALAAEFILPAALKKISEEAFADCESISGLMHIPDGTKSVCAQSFRGTDVFALELESGVCSVDEDAFGGAQLCYILVHGKETVIPAALADTAFYVFASSDSAAWENASGSLAERIDPANLFIHDGFYYEITATTARLLCAVDNSRLPAEVTIPVTLDGRIVTQIASNSFFGCEAIRTLNLPDGITVPTGALDALSDTAIHLYENKYSESPASDFYYKITNGKVAITGYSGNADIVRIPETIEGCPVTIIEKNAFRDSPVSEWILPDSIEDIYGYAFYNAQLRSIRLPENDKLELGGDCFHSTKQLKEIYLPEGLKEVSAYCFSHSGLEHVYISSSIETLQYNAFAYCTNLTRVSFAEGNLDHLITGCFLNTGLSKVILPESVTRIDSGTFTDSGSDGKFEIWMGAAVKRLPDLRSSSGKLFPDGAIIYAPESSYAAQWAKQYQNYEDATIYNVIIYGGNGCAEMFDGVHDYVFVSDTVKLSAGNGLHTHDILYRCSRCLSEKSYNQIQPEISCWRCEAKAAYGANASIPQNKFEFLDRYKLGGNVYYRIKLIADHNGITAGHEALFMNDRLKIVTDRDVISTLFRTHMYTGSSALPWEYTETVSDYPTLEKRKEMIASLLENASRSTSLASTFMKQDIVMEKLGATASAGLSLLWGDPEGALKSLKEAAVPDIDLLLTVMHVTILNKLAESTPFDAQHYTDSLSSIVDNDGFIICEEAEASLEAYANALALWQLCVDNSSGIINEIEACGTDVGVGVRNIMTMLKGAVGVTDNPYAKTGVLVTNTMYAAITQSDDIGNACTELIIKYIGDLSKIIADAGKSSCLGAFVALYKADAFALSEFLYVDGAMEKYEKSYNAFCLKSDTPLYETHDSLAK